MFIAEEPSGAESTIGAASRALLTVIRDAGTFGTVMVEWEVTNPSTDISPTRGFLTFTESQRSSVLEIVAQPDDAPEPAESFTVELRSVSGGARLAFTATTATITVAQNDDPIRFSNSFARVSEGDTATFTLLRGGQANGK